MVASIITSVNNVLLSDDMFYFCACQYVVALSIAEPEEICKAANALSQHCDKCIHPSLLLYEFSHAAELHHSELCQKRVLNPQSLGLSWKGLH